jgi:hypothetical protein
LRVRMKRDKLPSLLPGLSGGTPCSWDELPLKQ